MLDSCPTTAPAQRSHPLLTDTRQLTKLSPTDGMHSYSLGVLPHLPSQPIRDHRQAVPKDAAIPSHPQCPQPATHPACRNRDSHRR